MNSSLSGEFYKDLVDNLYDGVYFVDPERKITFWNKGAERLSGFTAAEVMGTACRDNLLMHVDSQGTKLCEDLCPLARTLADGVIREAEVFMHHKDGHRCPVLVRISPIRDSNGKITGAVEMFSDNSARISIQQRVEELEKLSYLDHLTGLANRRYLEISLHNLVNLYTRYQWNFGVLMIDIDNFKTINDSHGHEAGDLVLKMLSKTMLLTLRTFDHLGRWGGEEFLALLVNVTPGKLTAIAERLLALTQEASLSYGAQIIAATVSIGGTQARPGDTPASMMKRADEMLYRSKHQGKNRVTVG